MAANIRFAPFPARATARAGRPWFSQRLPCPGRPDCHFLRAFSRPTGNPPRMLSRLSGNAKRPWRERIQSVNRQCGQKAAKEKNSFVVSWLTSGAGPPAPQHATRGDVSSISRRVSAVSDLGPTLNLPSLRSAVHLSRPPCRAALAVISCGFSSPAGTHPGCYHDSRKTQKDLGREWIQSVNQAVAGGGRLKKVKIPL